MLFCLYLNPFFFEAKVLMSVFKTFFIWKLFKAIIHLIEFIHLNSECKFSFYDLLTQIESNLPYSLTTQERQLCGIRKCGLNLERLHLTVFVRCIICTAYRRLILYL